MSGAALRGVHHAAWPSPARAWFLVVVLCLANAFSFTDRFLISLLAQPIKEHFQISDTAIGLLQGTTFGLFYAALGLPLAWLADRMVRRNIVAAGSALWSAATVLAGVVAGFPAFFLTRAGVAVGEATLSPSGFSMLSDSFPPRRLSLPMGVFAAGVAIGTGASFIIGGALFEFFTERGGASFPLIGQCKPWQCVFITVGLAGLILPVLLLLVREPARRDRHAEAADTGSLREFTAFLGNERRALWPVVFGFAMATFASAGIASWTPTMLVRSYDVSVAQAGAWLGTLYLVSGIVGSLLGGAVADYAETRGFQSAKLAVAAGAIALQIVPNVAGPLSGSLSATLACYAATVVLGQMVAAPTAAALQLLTPNRMRAKVNATYYFVFNVIGIGLGPVAVALLSDNVFTEDNGLRPAIALVAATGGPIAAALMFTAMRNTRAVSEG